jgi:hypothetical protein
MLGFDRLPPISALEVVRQLDGGRKIDAKSPTQYFHLQTLKLS